MRPNGGGRKESTGSIASYELNEAGEAGARVSGLTQKLPGKILKYIRTGVRRVHSREKGTHYFFAYGGEVKSSAYVSPQLF